MLSRFSVSFTWTLYDAGAFDLTRCMSSLRISKTGCAWAGMCDLSPGAIKVLVSEDRICHV